MRTVIIHRNRNSREKALSSTVSDEDYTFDYRGRSKLLLFLKAFITSFEVPKADVYLVEGNCLLVAWFKKIRHWSCMVILMEHSIMFRERKSRIKVILLRKFLSIADGVIVISQMQAKDARRYVKCPIEIAHHFIDWHKFTKIKHKKEKAILFVADRIKETGHIKGFDIAFKTFAKVRRKIPKAKMYVLGSGSNGVVLEGIIGVGKHPIEEYLAKCRVIFAPSRYDAFNLSVAEAYCAGLYSVVSENVGAKEIVGSTKEKDYARELIKAIKKRKSSPRCLFTLDKTLAKAKFLYACRSIVFERYPYADYP